MENINSDVKEVMEILSREPWYIKVGFILGALVALVILIFILALCAEITKTLFTVDFAAICYFIYDCFQEGLPNVGMIAVGVSLCVILVLLFFGSMSIL